MGIFFLYLFGVSKNVAGSGVYVCIIDCAGDMSIEAEYREGAG